MRTHRILSAAIATLLTVARTHAVTETWDGGGGDDNFSTAFNWADNTAPASDVANTDLIFGGTTRLTPALTSAFSAKSLTFNNTAGAFAIGGLGPSLTIGAGGITNNDADTQTFNTQVIAAASQTINAASGALTFASGGLNISAGSNVTLNGSNTVTMYSIGGTGTLTKSNTGLLRLDTSLLAINADLVLTAGTTTLNPIISEQTFSSTGSIQVSGSATFNMNQNLTLTGGAQMTKTSGAIINLAVGKTLAVQSGSDFLSTAGGIRISGGNATITGLGSTLQAITSVEIESGSTVSVQNGGSVIAGTYMDIGRSTTGTLLVSGTGASITTADSSYWGASFGNATVTFSNSATANVAGVDAAAATSGNANIQVLSGAVVTNTGALTLGATTGGGSNGELVVSGTGSRWQQTVSGVIVGPHSGGAGVLTLTNGGVFDSPSGMEIRVGGTVNLDGGTLSVDGTFSNSGTFNFVSGALILLAGYDLTVGSGGLLGEYVTLFSNRSLIIGDTTTIAPLRTLTLDGGSLSTGTLVNNGNIIFKSGILTITGAGGFNIGAGALGSNVALGNGATLQVNNAATVNADGVLTVDGGTFVASTLTNGGLVDIRAGVTNLTGAVTNQSGADIFAARSLSTGGTLTNAAGARITLRDGTGRLSGAGALSNSGVITGDGVITKAVTNNASGQLRAETGDTLRITGAFSPNAGTLSLQGGTLEFSGALTNAAAGFVSGYGSLRAASLTNNGVMAFSGGNAHVFGDVTIAAGARVVTSGGGAVTTFYDDVTHNGMEIFTGTGTSTVIFGALSGAGPFTGTGTVYSIGDLRPGNSPATVSYGGSLVLGNGALMMEIGGLSEGTQYDSLHVASLFATDGTLALMLINGYAPGLGDVFDIFDAASISGSFDALMLPMLASNLTWNTSALYTTGTVSVISTLTPIEQWRLDHFGSPANAGNGANLVDFDGDGIRNLAEYGLGLDPLVPTGAGIPFVSIVTAGANQHAAITFSRPLSATDVNYVIEVSGDLATWLPGSSYSSDGDVPVNANTTEVSRSAAGGIETISVRDNTAVSASLRRLLRVRITHPTES